MPPPVRIPDARKALRALRWVAGFVDTRGYPPTIREVAEGLHYDSTSTSTYWLGVLADRGWIAREPKISRSIRVTPTGRAALAAANG
jgi:repressor LexA